MIDTIRYIFITFLIFGGFFFTIFTKNIMGIASMCLGIWLMQLMYEVE